MTSASRWHRFRVAYFEDDKSRLILGPVRAATNEITRQFSVPTYIQSNWRFGPHIAINVLCSPATAVDQVLPLIERHTAVWLEANASATHLVPDEYEALSRKIAVTELASPPFLPLLENNSVVLHEYEASTAMLAPLAVSRETFLCDSRELTYALLEQLALDRETVFLTLTSLMALAADQYRKGGFSRGFNSYRSHAEFFFAAYDKNDQIRGRFDLLDKKMGPVIDELTAAAIKSDFDHATPAPALSSVVAEWAQLIKVTEERNFALVEEHHEALLEQDALMDKVEALQEVLPTEFEQTGFSEREPSTMGKRMSHEIGQKMLASKEFMAFRTTVNFFYELLPVLAITPSQKFCLCYLTARSAERQYGIDWKDLMYNPGERKE